MTEPGRISSLLPPFRVFGELQVPVQPGDFLVDGGDPGLMLDCLILRICLTKLKQLNRQDNEDRKDREESSLHGLCGLGGSKFTVRTSFHIRFADG